MQYLNTKRFSLVGLLAGLALTASAQAEISRDSTDIADTGPEYGISFGLQPGGIDSNKITAVAYADFSSQDFRLVNGVVTIMVPSGAQLSPEIPALPDIGEFENHLGFWYIQKLTPGDYSALGFDEADLQQKDIYQAVLASATDSQAVVLNQALPLFSFKIAGGCQGQINMLLNNGDTQQAIQRNLMANFNNSLSVSVDSGLGQEAYRDNDAGGATLACPQARKKWVPQDRLH